MVLTVQQVRDRWTTLESGVFRRWNFLYLSCVDLFMIFVLLFQIYLLLSQRECFARRYWLTCRPITGQSTQMLHEASEQDLCFSASCYKALHGFTSLPPACLEMNICCLCTVSFLLLVCDRGAHCQFNNSSTAVNTLTVQWQYMLLPQLARFM